MALTDNLLARWQLDEGSGTSAADETGNFNGTLDSASWTTDGTYGNVYVSSAANEINCGTASLLGGTSSELSAAFWFYPTSLPAANSYFIAKYATVTDGRSFRLYHNSGAFFAQISSDGANNEALSVSSVFTVNQWHHIAFTYNAGSANVYVNAGTPTPLTYTTATQVFDNTTNANLMIGAASTTSDTGVVGNLREVAIWKRALTSDEVTAHYNGQWATAGAGRMLLLGAG